MLIKEYPLTDIFFIIVFEGRPRGEYRITRDSSMCDGKDSLCMGFLNRRDLTLTRKELMGRVAELTEEQVLDMFERAGVVNPYTNYYDKNEDFPTAKESFESYLGEQGWEKDLFHTYVVIPKKSKQLKGKKIPMEFEVGARDFGFGEGKEILDVYMTPINKKSKSSKFAVKIPKFLYDQAMTDTISEDRPKQDYIEAEALSVLHREMSAIVMQCHKIWRLNKDAENSTKVIIVNFSSSERSTRNDYNHAYTGQRISTVFNFFVAYKTPEGELFSFKEFSSGRRLSTANDKHKIHDFEREGRRRWMRGERPQVIMEWSQEKEDFLLKLEAKFRELSANLNEFLADLNEERLIELIKNNRLESSNMKLLN